MNETTEKVKVTEAAKILGIHRATVLTWIYKGILPAYRARDDCMWLIDRGDLDGLLKPSIALESAGTPNDENRTG